MAKKNKQLPISVGFVALGCPKNVVDSEKMLAHIGQAGFVLSGDIEDSDVIVINTCGFIKPAKDEAIGAIAEALEAKKTGKVKKVIVAGCLAERMGEKLFDEVDGIDAIVGLGERDSIAEIIKKTIHSRSSNVYLKEADTHLSDDTGRLLITPRHSVYLRISEGCDRKCSFCTIPDIRGRFRSKPSELVIAEARELADSGAVELNIIAQDSNYYGKDAGLTNGLSNLIKELEKIEPLKWIRLMYLYPDSIDDVLIETIAKSEKILNYIDMPLQHINDDILKAMRRTDRKEKTLALIEKLRRVIPDVVLRTTIIVGFPAETDGQFEELLEFVRRAKFDALGCFQFYPEAGTGAARLGNQVPEDIKQARAEKLMLAQQEIAFAKAKEQIGRELICLVDDLDDKNGETVGLGRFYGQAPQIDSICYIKDCSAQPGDFVRAKVVGTQDYDLGVEQICD